MTQQPTSERRAFDLPAFRVMGEPELCFDPQDKTLRDVHPLKGLLSYGPFSRDQIGMVRAPIRLATIAPFGQSSIIDRLVRELDGTHRPKERRNYLPEFPGFGKVFRVPLATSVGSIRSELSASLDAQLDNSQQPHRVLAKAIVDAVHSLRQVRNDFDVVLLYLPERWNRAFERTDNDDFDLHDFVKAHTAALGIPIQILNDHTNGAVSYYCRCSVAWRLSIALYCKAGGVPWTIAEAEPGTAFIGLTYALRGGAVSAPRFAICCSQIFDSEGAGLDFVAYEAEDVKVFGKNPFLSRPQMMKVMSRSLSIYQKRHGGSKPHRIVVHKSTEFRREEVEGCFDAFSTIADVELLHVQQNTPWRSVLLSDRQRVDPYPVHRGSHLILSSSEALLWTQGNSISLGGGSNYYKEGKGIPEPLLLKRYAGHGDIGLSCREILALSKMDWNNDGPYDRLPVTMSYASTLAGIVKRLPELQSKPYAFRLFM